MSDDPMNPDEESTYPDEVQPTEDPDAGHDDIMKRLVDYQRQLREGVEPTEAAAVAWHREPRDLAQGDQPHRSAEPEQPTPPEEPSTTWGEPDVVDVSSREPEVHAEGEVRSEERDEDGSLDRPSDRVEILTSEQAQASPARPWDGSPASDPQTARTGVSDRIEQLEGTLDRLSRLLGDLRENFQGMAVNADERLAEIEAEIERNRERPDESS